MNVLNFIFLIFCSIIFLNWLIIIFEPYLPALAQIFLYGKLSNKGKRNELIRRFEVPKSFFKHFYGLVCFWLFWGLYLILKGMILKLPAPPGIIYFFDLVAGGKDRPILINSTSGLIVIILLIIQYLRRLYETCFMQIFSKSRINILHYLAGHIHFICLASTILANTEGFVGNSIPTKMSLSKISILQYICVLLFYLAWKEQYNANKIIVNLRKTKDGKINSETHLIPKGGIFELISSPHMLFDILIYVIIWIIIPGSTTWGYCTIWVILNQIQSAWQTQKWYLENFPEYPKQRRAIIPYIL